jgi:carbon monoxide dehydrogenase subunit G
VGEGRHEARFARAVGPMTIRLEGELGVDEVEPGRAFVLTAKVGSLLSGKVRAHFTVRLAPEGPGATRVAWDGGADLSGMVARIAPTIAPDYGARGAGAVFARLKALAEAPSPVPPPAPPAA